MKSLPLIAYPIRNSSQENGIVVDLFGGSGSTLMAAEQMNRKACLMELDPKYASVIVQRYASAKGNIDDIFVVRNRQKLVCASVYQPSDDDLSFSDGSVEDKQNGPKNRAGLQDD